MEKFLIFIKFQTIIFTKPIIKTYNDIKLFTN